MKVEIEVEEAVYKFLEQMATYTGLTVSEYASSTVNASILFSLSHRDEINETMIGAAPDLTDGLMKYVNQKRNKIKEDKK